MPFVLSENRKQPEEVVHAFRRYSQYLASVKPRLPSSAYELATSGWYFDPRDHRCPHDAWLESLTIREDLCDSIHLPRCVEVAIRLLGAYHDGYIELHYPDVRAYSFGGKPATGGKGHGDWLYDEFRLSENGLLLHEIEWEVGRWEIEATDVVFGWAPTERPSPA